VPTYQYACTACGHRFEAVQSFSDPALTVCPECEGRLRKVYSGVGVVFKGSGFYRTDSRTTGPGAKGSASKGDGGSSGTSSSAGTGASGGEASGSSGSGSGSSDAKPAASGAKSSGKASSGSAA
jgi:putative FmdB family regulatory protein